MEYVLQKYRHLIKPGAGTKNVSSLSVKLAKEAIFGEGVMKKCTPGGTRELPGLPRRELYTLKKILLQQFPRYWECLHDFIEVWKKCRGSIEQACKRERNKFNEQ